LTEMKIRNLLNIFLSGEFLKFGVVGGIGFCVDFGSYFIMTRFLGFSSVYCLGLRGQSSYFGSLAQNASESCSAGHFPLIGATMVSVFLAILSNFFFNKFWTFRKSAGQGDVAKQGISYFGLNIFTYVLNQILVGFFIAELGVLAIFPNYVDILAKMLAVAIVLFFNFFGSKFLIFRKKAAV